MNKKLLIAAVGAALVAGPMLAAQAAPTVYGSFHMSLDRYDTDGATTSQEKGLMNSNSSRFGLKGDEDLGGGLKSIYQVESGIFAADNGLDPNGSSTGTASSANISGFNAQLRNTYVGFTGSSWGTVKFGRHDTPVKDLGRAVELFNEQIGDARNVTGSQGTFDARINNMMRYDSPDFGGVRFALQYNTPEAKSTQTFATTGPTTVTSSTATTTTSTITDNIRTMSGNVTFTQGPLYVGLGYEKQMYPSSAKKDATDMRLVGKYSMGDLTLAALYETMSDLAGTSGADRKAWGLGAGFKLANNMLKLQYYTTDKVDAQTTQNGGNIMALGVDHSFSKTTLAYFAYATASNDGGTSAFNVSSSTGGHATTNVPTVGKVGGDAKAYSFGTIIKF